MAWSKEAMARMSGKTVIVTGGSSGIGYSAALRCAELGAKVIIASRSEGASQAAVARIKGAVNGAEVVYVPLDLADLASVRACANVILEQNKAIDGLVNNAGVMMTPEMKTKDGFEYQLGINHLGHFLLTSLLADRIVGTPGSRVVNISSLAHRNGTMDFDNLMYENGGYTPFVAYRRSKLANILFHYELQRYFAARGKGTVATAAHPGLSRTNLGRYVTKGIRGKLVLAAMLSINLFFVQSANGGALPTLRALTDADAVGGEYYGPSGFREYRGQAVKVPTTEYSKDAKLAKRLWDVSVELTGAKWAK